MIPKNKHRNACARFIRDILNLFYHLISFILELKGKKVGKVSYFLFPVNHFSINRRGKKEGKVLYFLFPVNHFSLV